MTISKFKISNKVLSVLLCLAMLLSYLPLSSLTAFAADTETKVLYIGELDLYNQYTTDGTTAVDGAPADDTFSYAYWDYETKTLTLKNYTQTITAKEYAGNTYSGIYYENDINLVLIGENAITVVSTDSSYDKEKNTSGIESSGSLAVTGTGSLTISSPVRALYASDDITLNCEGYISVTTTSAESGIRATNTVDIKKGTINISSDYSAISASQLSVANATVTAYSNYNAVFSVYYDITIKDSTVKAIHNKPNFQTAYNGIDSSNGSISIERSKIEASGSKGGTRVTGRAIEVEGNISILDSTVTASAGTGLHSNGSSCSITNSTVNLTSTGTANSARGIYGNGVSITNSKVTVTSAKAAFNNVPTVSANESIIYYGTDETAATEQGAKSAADLSSAYSQKYVRIEPYDHTHNLSYSANGDTITATCTADDCLNPNVGSFTLQAPSSLIADGKAKQFTYTGSISGVTPKITYSQEPIPQTAGTYTVTMSITADGETYSVSQEYTILEGLYVTFNNVTSGTTKTVDWEPTLEPFNTSTGIHFLTSGYNNKDSVVGTNYTVQWYDAENKPLSEAPTDAGTYTIKVTLNDSLSKTCILQGDTLTYTIKPLDLSTEIIGLYFEGGYPVYTGEKADLSNAYVGNSSYTLDKSEYTLEYYEDEGDTHIDAGQHKLKIVGNGKNVTGEVIKTYNIGTAQLDLPVAAKRTYTYDGTPKATDFSGETLPTGYASIEALYWYKAGSSRRLAEAPSDVGEYEVYVKYTPTDAVNYRAKYRKEAFEITPRKLTADVRFDTSKVYDTSTNVTLTCTPTNAVDGDSILLTAKAVYDSPDVGTGKTITVTFQLSGNDKKNYTAPDNYTVTTGEITPRTVTVYPERFSARFWDGTDMIPLTKAGWTMTGQYASDGLTLDLSKASAKVETSDAGQNKPVIFENVIINGNDKGNYKIEIDPRTITIQKLNLGSSSVTVTFTGDTPVYTGNTVYPENAVVTVEIKNQGTITLDNSLWEFTPDTGLNNSKAGKAYACISATGASSNVIGKTYIQYTIAKASYDMSGAKWNYAEAFDYDGTEKSVEVIGLPDDVTVSGYEDNKKTAVGDYTAKVTFQYDSDNYNAPVLADCNWSIKNDWTPTTEYTVSTPNSNGWLNADLVITAADGYELSLTNTADGVWSETLTGAVEGADSSVTLYVRNKADGTISLAKTVYYKLDKTNPTGTVEFVGREPWQEFVNTITFGLFFKEEVTVKAEATDALSKVASIGYAVSDKDLTLDEVKAITEWTAMPADGVGVTVEDEKKFVYFIRITDNAGNVTYLSTDGAKYDTTVPAISGIENGATYYTTQVVTVEDKNLASVELDGETVTLNNGTLTLAGNVDATYTIKVTDKAGNITEYTVTMKTIAELTKSLDDITVGDVTSEDKETIEQVIGDIDEQLANDDLTEDEKTALEETKTEAQDLLDKLDEAANADDTENTEKVKDITADNVTPEDKTDLEKAKEDLEKTLDDYSNNLTEDEKKAIEDEIDRIDKAIAIIEKVEAVEDKIGSLPENITKNDEAAIKAADEALGALSDYEKSLVDKDAKKALDDAKAALAELNKPADTTSPNTGDNSNLWLWVALLFISGGGVIGTTLYGRKRKTEEN